MSINFLNSSELVISFIVQVVESTEYKRYPIRPTLACRHNNLRPFLNITLYRSMKYFEFATLLSSAATVAAHAATTAVTIDGIK